MVLLKKVTAPGHAPNFLMLRKGAMLG